jgi:DNA-directed RNA polymerase subunit RPC12/RpoP
MEKLKWEFECNSCQRKFKVAVPRGPEEERHIKCPKCAGKDIKNLSLGGLEMPVCGG